MKYIIYSALHEDIDAGWVWIGTRPCSHRCVVQITNRDNGRRAFCDALEIDPNFLSRYNQAPRRTIQNPAQSLVISDWYRKRLEAQKGEEAELEVVLASGPIAKLRSCLQHPQTVVRISTWLAIISVILGGLGFALGLLSLRGANTEQDGAANRSQPVQPGTNSTLPPAGSGR
jgi:hypothetical protein